MSVDYTRTTGAETPEDSETSFAPAPIWDRKARGSGAGRAFFENAAAEPEAAPMMGRQITTTDTAIGESITTTEDAPFLAPPAERTDVRREGSMAPGAIAVGVLALAALAAAGWYATRPADNTLTPGTPSTAIAAAPVTTATGASTTRIAANTPSADNAVAAGPDRVTTTTHRTVATSSRSSGPVVRSRSTRAAVSPDRPSAATSGVNTGATENQNSLGAVGPTPSTATPPPAATAPLVNTMPDVSPAPPASTTSPTPPQ